MTSLVLPTTINFIAKTNNSQRFINYTMCKNFIDFFYIMNFI